MARPSENLHERIWGEWYPFITLGVGIFMLCWLFFLGDLVMGR